MKINKTLASLLGYLCGDGYVIKNPENQKHKYYYIGFRNTNIVLLKDFQSKFEKIFKIRPIITKNNDRCKVQNKVLYNYLIDSFDSFYSCNWTIPNISNNSLSSWLRSYYDCDGWVACIPHKDRKIGLESINEAGIKSIQKFLKSAFGVESSLKKRKTRKIWSLTICGRDDILKFKKHIGFLHPAKSKKLDEAVNSYIDYKWKIPRNREGIVDFINIHGRISNKRKEVRFNSIIKKNLTEFQHRLRSINISSRINGPWTNPYGSIWYCLSIKKHDYDKLMRR